MTSFVPYPTGKPQPPATSHRQRHVRNLYSILHLSLLRQDHVRANKAWNILIGCREFNWEHVWKLHSGLQVVVDSQQEPAGVGPTSQTQQAVANRHADYVESLMRGGGRMSIALLQEHVHYLLARQPPQPEVALERLEIFLPGLPYAVCATLHALAAMSALALSVEGRAFGAPPNLSYHRQALSYIQKAVSLDSSSAASSQHSVPPPSHGPSFYTSLLQLIQSTAKWADLERAEARGQRTSHHSESSESPVPPLRDQLSDTESETDTVVDSTSRLAKREPLVREVSLSVDSEEGRSRASSVPGSETSVGSRRVKAERLEEYRNAQNWGAEDDDDDEQGYDMDMDEDD